MVYRICKSFEVENAHMLFKHPEKCKFPHGHSRRVEIVVSAKTLNEQDMVCDFKAIKLAVAEFIDSFDHAICVNSQDPLLESLRSRSGARIIVYEKTDPTTEVMARHIFETVEKALTHAWVSLPNGVTLPNGVPSPYVIPKGVKLERIRLWETSSSWAEVSAD
jgi:6-pyruvoyltetrahydropterin/6-carboxytetrahydropterin synthase